MRIIKNSAHICSHKLTIIFNNGGNNGKFQDILKYADIIPDFKKGDPTGKSNFRPISTLSNFLKIFDKLTHNQVNSCMELNLSKYLGRFCRNYNNISI